MKIALFDFCETIVKFQTADAFVHFVRHRSNDQRMNFINKIHFLLIKSRIIAILENLFPKSSINKRLTLFQLRRFSKSELNEYGNLYYYEKIKPGFIKSILLELIRKKEEGYRIFVVTGGYDIYLNYFVEEFNIDALFSTRIQYDRADVCTGKIDGVDCLWNNKVKLLESYFGSEYIDKSNSVAYSDSVTDIPMLNWVQNGIVVSNNKVEKWMENYEIILWEN